MLAEGIRTRQGQNGCGGGKLGWKPRRGAAQVAGTAVEGQTYDGAGVTEGAQGLVCCVTPSLTQFGASAAVGLGEGADTRQLPHVAATTSVVR